MSESDTHCSSKVGKAGCVVFPARQNVLQDAICLIVDVVVYRSPASHHHLKMLLRVPTRPRR
jgi:hypothetical protein